MKKTAIIYITESGNKLAQRLTALASDTGVVRFSPEVVTDLWRKYETLVFIMATGIVVRTIAPLLKDKKTDPAIVVLDDTGRFVISLAGGHLGGANELAREIAGFLGGEAVITTASDVNGLPPLDLWARDHNLIIENWHDLPQVGTRYVNNGGLRIYSDIPFVFPDEFLKVADPRFADAIISNRRDVYAGSPRCTITGEGCSADACRVKGQVYLRPVNLVVGIGCNSGTSGDEIEAAVRGTLEEHNLVFLSVGSLATISIKANEPGLRLFAEKYGFPLHAFLPEELNRVEGITRSDTVFRATAAHAVAEPAALLAAGTDKLVVPKQKKGNVTVAVTETKNVQGTEFRIQSEKKEASEPKTGRIYIVGTGPGSLEHITPAALEAIRRSDVIVGYGTYLDLIAKLLQGKEVLSTGMTQEVDRCRKAMELALANRTVAVISGGDPGVYAMAGLVFELLRSEEGKGGTLPDVEVIPGISALNASASRLGAPLMHDFACISLSDRLTPWEVIEKRLEAAAAADFVIVLYNPRSKGRSGHIGRAREIILKHRGPAGPATVVGIVKGAMREHEAVIVTDLENMRDSDIDMQTTVIIGNSKTFLWNHLMITPRGYENKFAI
jgi:cobalt-precorrin 5A hydrolase / cobalt-factor III methyltransferase / precorrin-3B C17-methyltransferase